MVSPGNFHASAAYLPSSFAMCAGMLGAAAFMNWRGGVRTAQGIFWFAVAGILGWPFAAALSFPFVFEDAIIACFSGKAALVQSFGRISRGVASGVLVVVCCLRCASAAELFANTGTFSSSILVSIYSFTKRSSWLAGTLSSTTFCLLLVDQTCTALNLGHST